jgi:hypothetical protein
MDNGLADALLLYERNERDERAMKIANASEKKSQASKTYLVTTCHQDSFHAHGLTRRR